MEGDDGTSEIVEEYRVGGDSAIGEVPDEMYECAKKGADVCPEEVIIVNKI